MPDSRWCGTTTGYSYGCRCPDCRAAWSELIADADRDRQIATASTARAYGAPWTPEEDMQLLDRQGRSVAALARSLGRTYYAVRARITALNSGQVIATT